MKPLALPWRRLTPPLSVGAPGMGSLAVIGSTLVAAGDGIKVSTDDGATFTDASENVETASWGGKEHVHELTVVGDEALAVSERATYRSSDHGKRWLRCSDPPAVTDPKRFITHARLAAYGGGVAYVSYGDRLFRSVDAGRTFSEVPTKLPLVMPDRLVVTDRALFAFNSGNSAMLFRSRDHGTTWKPLYDEMGLIDDEALAAPSATRDKLYVSTTLGGLLESADEGETWTRRWLGRGPGNQAPRAHRVVATGGGLLLQVGDGLMRLEKEGKPTPALAHRLLAVAARNDDIFALGADYLSRSRDGGRTFTDQRFAGLQNDVVDRVSGWGKNIGIIASGPTAYFSTDSGATFQRGPDLGRAAEVLAIEDGIYFSTTQGEVGVVLFQPAAGGGPRRLGPSEGFGTAAPRLLGAEGASLAIYPWSLNKIMLSRDGGATFSDLGPPPNQFSGFETGAVRGDELIITPGGYPYRSKGGGPFESLFKAFKPDNYTGAKAFFRAGKITYILGIDVWAWDHTKDRPRKLTASLHRDPKEEYLTASAVNGRMILAQLNSKTRPGLYLSRDLGATFRPIESPGEGYVSGLASCDGGILATGRGLWLLPAQ